MTTLPPPQQQQQQQSHDHGQGPTKVILDEHVQQSADRIAIADIEANDNYLTNSHLPRNDTCYLCTESLQTTRPLISTACACKAVMHLACFHKLIQYGYIAVKRDGKTLPPFIRECAKCRQYNLGAVEEQYTNTSLAYDNFRRLTKQEQQENCDTLLSPIIYSTLEIIKSIRRDWRGTIEPNGILSMLYARLGRCYYHRMQDSKLPLLRDEAEQISVLADLESLRLHDKKSTTLGVGSIQWVHYAIVHQRGVGNVEFGRLYLPVVLDYLFPLVNNTMNTNEAEARVDTQDVLRHKHAMAQSHLVDILNSDFRSELAVFQDTRHKFSEFLSMARRP
jgi:hypothetical protein